MRKKYWPLILTLFYFGCSTPSQVKITSLPTGADAEIVDANGISSNLGKTPLVLKDTEVYKNANQSIQLRVKKEGYHDQNIVLLKPLFNSEINLYVKLTKEDVNQNATEQLGIQEKIAGSIAKVNGLIQAKQYNEAETAMNSFVDLYPTISVGYDYLGNINYLQKKFAKALKYYNKAMTLNPANPERKLLIEKIQSSVKFQSGDAQ